MEMIKFNYMLEIDILRHFSPRKVGVLRGAFEGFGCPKRHPDALLAKTMATCEVVKLGIKGVVSDRPWVCYQLTTPSIHGQFGKS